MRRRRGARENSKGHVLIVTQDILALMVITQKPLCKLDLTAELSEDDEDIWLTLCTVQLTMYLNLHLQKAANS